jgi:hypothetical protein
MLTANDIVDVHVSDRLTIRQGKAELVVNRVWGDVHRECLQAGVVRTNGPVYLVEGCFSVDFTMA